MTSNADTHGRGSIQIPTLTRFALKHGYAAYVGKGLAVESNIHVLDLARAYVYILHNLEELVPEQTLAHPYYYCECTGDEEPSWKDVASLIGESLHKVDKAKDPAPRHLDESMYRDMFSDATPEILGGNSRNRAVRLRELGWAPREKDWKRSFVEDEFPNILKEELAAFDGYRLQGGDRLVGHCRIAGGIAHLADMSDHGENYLKPPRPGDARCFKRMCPQRSEEALPRLRFLIFGQKSKEALLEALLA